MATRMEWKETSGRGIGKKGKKKFSKGRGAKWTRELGAN